MREQTLIAWDDKSVIALMYEFGVAVVPSRIPPAIVQRLRERVQADLDYLGDAVERASPKAFPGHVVTQLPADGDLLFHEVLFDEIVLSTCAALFGPLPRCRLESYQCNVNLPGSVDQGLHTDMPQLWPRMDATPPPHAIIVNIPLVDVDLGNGAIEVWPRSHRNPLVWIGNSQWIDEASAEQQRSIAPPLQLRTPAGSLILRDGRLWHRGRKNASPAPRPMLSLVYVVPWIRTGLDPIRLPRAAEAMVQDQRVESNVEFVEGDFDYRGTIVND